MWFQAFHRLTSLKIKFKTISCHVKRHLSTTATPHNRLLSPTATSLQRPPLYNSHLSTTATSLQRPPLYNDHLSTTTTSLQRPPLYNGHLSTTATSLKWPPLYNGHLSTTTTSLQRPPLPNGHLSTTTTFLKRPISFPGLFPLKLGRARKDPDIGCSHKYFLDSNLCNRC